MPELAYSGLRATRIIVLMSGVACCGAFQSSSLFGSAPPALAADPAARRPRPPPASRPAMQLRETYEMSRGMRHGRLERRPSAGWGVLRDMPAAGRRRPRLQRDLSTGALPGSKKNEFILYRERWLMLAIVSALALLSDWACFAAVGGTKTWVNAFNKSPEDLIDIFLFSNVFACFLYTDLTRRFGLKTVITVASGFMATGCWLRSGDAFSWSLPSYNNEIVGTILIGMAQPFFQCAPPLLSATWFGNKERSLSTAICLNANQLGIASAFIVGAGMLNGKDVSGVSMDEYLSIITTAATVVFGITAAFFKERPPTPPTGSAAAHLAEEKKRVKAIAEGGPDPWITYPQTAVQLFKTPGFLAPTLAFVGSIAVTNAVSAFTSETMHRAGFLRETVIDGLGAGFQVAVMAGGIVLGGFVDRTKQFKQVTLGCFAVTLSALGLLGIAEGYDINLPQWAVVGALLTLGAAAGPVQPINAELAVEVSYPSDENAVEATQQLCGNLFSALLVPLCVAASQSDFQVLPGLGPNTDIRGDTLLLMALVVAVSANFAGLEPQLKRSELDSLDVELVGDYMSMGGYTRVLKLWRKAALFQSFSSAFDDPDSLYQEAVLLFEKLDLNQDGLICREEFILGFPELDIEVADELISEIDADRNGMIDMDELWSVIQSVAAEESRVKPVKQAQ